MDANNNINRELLGNVKQTMHSIDRILTVQDAALDNVDENTGERKSQRQVAADPRLQMTAYELLNVRSAGAELNVSKGNNNNQLGDNNVYRYAKMNDQ